MKCGFCEFDITPAMGSIIPGDFKARYSRSVRDPIYLRAFVAREGEKSIAIVSIDACGITLDITERIRTSASSQVNISPSAIMVMATHCHGGGPTLNWGEEVVADPAYLDMLVEKASCAIETSYNNANESELRLGRSELHGYAFTRVYKMKDGSLRTNPLRNMPELIDSPSTTIDPEVLALGVWQDGKPVGAIVNYATHPATVANDEISGDYISELCRVMKEAYGDGFVTVFINGACGNINRLNPFDPETWVAGRERVIGRALAVQAQEALRCASPIKCTELAFTCDVLTVHLRKPSAEALIKAKEVLESKGDDLSSCVPGTPDYPSVFFAIEALRAMADKRTLRELTIQLFRIGDVFVVGNPCQIFVQFGKSIKEGMGAPCFVSAFANDYAGYVATRECFGEADVYETKLCPTSALEPEAGYLLVDAILKLRQKIDKA